MPSFGDKFQRLIGPFDAEHRTIILWKMEGFSKQEIADRLRLAVPTVERRLRLFRKVWTAEFGGKPPV